MFAQVAPYDGGWVGIRFSRQSPTAVEVVVLDEELEEVSATPGGHGLAVSSDGSHVSWIDVTGGGDTGTLVNAPVDGTRPSYAPVPSDSQVEGFLGNDLVAASRFDGTTGETSYTQVAADEDSPPRRPSPRPPRWRASRASAACQTPPAWWRDRRSTAATAPARRCAGPTIRPVRWSTRPATTSSAASARTVSC